MLMAISFIYDLELGDDAGVGDWVGGKADEEESSEERADDKDDSWRWGQKFS